MQKHSSSSPPYTIWVTRSHFYLKCALHNLPKHQNPQCLQIQRQTCKISTIQPQDIPQQIPTPPLSAHLIIGLLVLSNQIYLLYVSQTSLACPHPEDDPIYQVQAVSYLTFRSNTDYKYSPAKKTNQQILKYLQQTFLKKIFYFRYISDITLSLENQLYHQKSTQNKFFWNRHLVQIFRQNSCHLCWRIPFLQGFVKYEPFANDSFYLMIARRSKVLSGPKLLNRGLCEDGDKASAANFVEVQEIYKVGDQFFSYVSLRGSVPVYWRQAKGTMEFKSDDNNHVGFNLHLTALQKAYPNKKIYFISWLTRDKEEQMLRDKLDICFYHSQKNYQKNDNYMLSTIDIDENNKNALYFLKETFHNESKKGLLLPYQDNFFWYLMKPKGQGKKVQKNMEVLVRQKLIYRVNCVDCTQRTNAIMIELSLKTLRDIDNTLTLHNKPKINFQRLENVVVNAWKQLGNRICRLYLGQEELEIGKRHQSGFFTMFNLYRDPANSEFRQKVIDNFLNPINPDQLLSVQKNLQRKLNITQNSTITHLHFYILTWNCNNLNPLSMNQLSKELLLNFNRGKVDVVIICLQEMVELSTYNVLITIDEQIKTKWKEIITETLNEKLLKKQQKFDFVAQENLVAITTWVFIKNSSKQAHLQAKESTVVKTGFANGLGGNKGGVIISLRFGSTWISLVNCHLTAGQGKKSERKQTLQLILYGWIEEKFKNRLQQSDVIFLIGDLNFRLEETQEQIKSVIYDVRKKFNKQSLKMGTNMNQSNEELAKCLKPLWEKDELINYQKDTLDYLFNFKEKPLAFMPTYKFIKKSHVDEYDEKRSPAWCDRILYEQKIDKLVNPKFYQDIDINLSDHKPVYGLFEVKIKKIEDKNQYMKFFEHEKKLYLSPNGNQVSNQPKIKDSNGRALTISYQNERRKKSQTEIDFFNQKQQNLLGFKEVKQKKIESQKEQSENLLDLPQSQYSKKSSSPTSKKPQEKAFQVFSSIADDVHKSKLSSSKQNHPIEPNTNLLDLL